MRALLAVALACSAVACNRGDLYKLLDKPRSIAVLFEPKNEVNVRRAHDLVWNRAATGTELANYDAVRTGSVSTGIIRYNDRTEVTIGENTMVIVVDKLTRTNVDGQGKTHSVDETVIALPNGTVEGNLPASSDKVAELVVKTRQGWVTATNLGRGTPSRFRTTVRPTGQLEVRSDAGDVKVLAQGKEKTIRQNESITLGFGDSPGPQNEAELLAAETYAALPSIPDRLWDAVTPKAKEPVVAAQVRGEDISGLDLFLLDEPRENTVIKGDIVLVSGEISGRLRVFLDGKAIVPGPDGKFSLKIDLTPGVNTLKFKIVGPGDKDVQYEVRKVIRRS